MSVFNDNIINPLSKSIRAEQEAIECVWRIVDRVNNNFGACRVVVDSTCDLFHILMNEIICDHKEHKMDLKECFAVSAGTYIEHAYNQSKDPEKWSGEFAVHYAYVDLDRSPEHPVVVRDNVWVPVELYRYPRW